MANRAKSSLANALHWIAGELMEISTPARRGEPPSRSGAQSHLCQVQFNPRSNSLPSCQTVDDPVQARTQRSMRWVSKPAPSHVCEAFGEDLGPSGDLEMTKRCPLISKIPTINPARSKARYTTSCSDTGRANPAFRARSSCFFTEEADHVRPPRGVRSRMRSS